MRARVVKPTTLSILLVLGGGVPAFAEAAFGPMYNPAGSAAAPYAGKVAQYMVLSVSEKFVPPPRIENVDIKVDVPDGWTNVVCLEARTQSGGLTGVFLASPARGWTCAVEAPAAPGAPTVIHWSRATGSTLGRSGIYFPFVALTPSAGTYTFNVHQTYSSGEVVDWVDTSSPPGCVTGTNEPGTACANPAPTRVVGPDAGKGLWLVASDGGVFALGDARFYGSTGALKLNKPIVGMAPTPMGKGYWLVASDGGVFSYGDAVFYGSTGALKLDKPIVGMAATPSGNGYWLVASDGGIFSYGDAELFGSTRDVTLAKPIVGMAPTPSGLGYWLVASDGGIFSYGDAVFYGSAGAMKLNKPIAGMNATPTGSGYWLIASDGGSFAYGDATPLGSGASSGSTVPFRGAALTPTGKGYWMATESGKVFAFGDAASLGSMGTPNQPVVGIAPLPR
jgi:hypothetical protein